VEVACPHCGSGLQLNRNLAGTTVSCPHCGGAVAVPDAPVRIARSRRSAAPPARKPRRKAAPFTFWLLGAQACIAVLGLSCLAGAFLRSGWHPPEWSYFRENPWILVAAGIGLLLAGWTVVYLPVLTSLGVAVFVLCVCGHSYVLHQSVDASRVLALTAAMLALWLALQHRRKVTG